MRQSQPNKTVTAKTFAPADGGAALDEAGALGVGREVVSPRELRRPQPPPTAPTERVLY